MDANRDPTSTHFFGAGYPLVIFRPLDVEAYRLSREL